MTGYFAAPIRTTFLAVLVLALSIGHRSSAEIYELVNIADEMDDRGFVINGDEVKDFSGISVSNAGDVNGDGISDLLVGAYRADPDLGMGPVSMAGKSYVVFGRSSGEPINLSAIALDDNPILPLPIIGNSGGFVINGEELRDESGFSVSAAGDVNGDGLADILIGAHTAAVAGVMDVGKSYVVFGKPDGAPVNLSAVALPDAMAVGDSGGFMMFGDGPEDFSGDSVSGAGDVNGDGLADLVIGARETNMKTHIAGYTYVVFGRPDGSPIALDSLEVNLDGFEIHGDLNGDFSGSSVSGAGDVNGDGLDDLVLGAEGADPDLGMGPLNLAGKAFVVFGKKDFLPVELADIVDPMMPVSGFVMNGVDALDRTGFSVSGAGDVNGDGLSDVIVGATRFDPTTNLPGRAYVVFGKGGPFPTQFESIDLSDVAMDDMVFGSGDSGGFLIEGQLKDSLGTSVSAAGDVNGDGFDDVIVGAKTADPSPNGENSGSSYVVYGKINGDSLDVFFVQGSMIGSLGFKVNGEADSNFSGTSVSGAGDVNSDGVADIIIGALGADVGARTEAGKSYVLFSPESTSTPLPVKAAYTRRARAGDGAGGEIVTKRQFGEGRASIDFSDEDNGDDGAGNASTETVTLRRVTASISNLDGILADVAWQVTSNRVNWASADVEFHYLDSEIAALDEDFIQLYKAPTLSGPWVAVTGQSVAAERNAIGGTVTEFSFFAIADPVSVPIEMPLKSWPVACALLGVGLATLGALTKRRRSA